VILHIAGMDDRLHQQSLRLDEDVTLLVFDFLACIEARRIDTAPPFSVLLTLCAEIAREWKKTHSVS
jgi:hypothetical protein